MYLPDLEHILAGCRGRRVAVLGDLMLDRYIWGRVERISPEAPVPVVAVERRSHSLGGSANVVHNLQALGAEALPFGVVGADEAAELLVGMLREAGIETAHILPDDERPTTLKTRIIAHEQHVARIDEERVEPIRPILRQRLLEGLLAELPRLDALIFQDYDKGVLDARLIGDAREAARTAGVFSAVDPKLAHFHDYGAVDLFKPNEKEIAGALGRSLVSDEDAEQAGREFLAASGARELALTRGARGMLLFDEAGGLQHLPALRSAIVDVSGAGDTVIAALVLARAQGLPLAGAGRFASLCAAVVCGELGAVPARPEAVRRLNAWLEG
jgi:D-glycero-beta-D-manno-heptose-7-phosphate kinase